MNLEGISIKIYVGKLFELAEIVDNAGFWYEDYEINLDIFRHLRAFISLLVAADGVIDDSELEIIRDLFYEDNKRDKSIIKEIGKHKINSLSTDFEIPLYLESMTDYDLEHDTNTSALAVKILREIGLNVIAIDGESDQTEMLELVMHLARLKNYIEDKGIDPEVDLDSDTENDSENEEKRLDTKSEEPESEDLDSLMKQLNHLIGLKKVKHEVTTLTNLVRVQQIRKEKGLPLVSMSLHLVFTGNPGTGKTTVARLISKIYKVLGLLSKGHLVEVDRSGLVAGYVGQTAIKVKEVVQSALGGVLFIDEAYSLVSGNDMSDYGREAINTLLKAMEDNRDNLVVIVAGYPDKITGFLESNPGLKSRFNKFIHFEDYSSEELHAIFKQMCEDSGYMLTESVLNYSESLFQIIFNTNENFGNARGVRNIFEQVISNQANRIALISNPTNEDLSFFDIVDFG